MTNKTTYLKDYQPPVFHVQTVRLEFDLYDDKALVTSELNLSRNTPGNLHLYGDELELVSLELNGESLPVQPFQGKSDLILKDCPDSCRLKIVTRIKPQENTQLSGLYRSNHLFCTQCEAEGFRRITYYPDRPDVLAIYTTRIIADKQNYPVLLSNGNCIDSGETKDGRHWVEWHDPFPKPSYLFALVAGNLSCVKDKFTTMNGREIDLRIYVEPGNEDKCAHAMLSLKNSMQWDEQQYGREYDLDIFMIVAVSDFNMGAMENKGLNIFNSKYILARKDNATDMDFADVEGVVAHEYFHNWTGNRVTCRDWFQLSLKEGLTVYRDQEFSRDMNSRDVNRIMDVKALKATQFPEDAGSMAHPVRPASYQEINNFYTATVYNKGAEVIRMQHTLLGAAGFRKGMDLYFARHDGQAVTIDDFVSAMEDAGHRDLKQFKLWYSQAGTPRVDVETEYNSGLLTIKMKQFCPPTPECQQKKPFHIPIKMALFDPKSAQPLLRESVLELTQAEQTFEIDRLPVKPVVSLLRDFSAPIQLNYALSLEEKLDLLRLESDGYVKWDIAQGLATSLIHQKIKHLKEMEFSKVLSQTFSLVLQDNGLDRSLRAELLTPPGFEEVIAPLQEVNVSVVEDARDWYKVQLGQALFEEVSSLYSLLWQEEDHAMHAEAYSRRKLRNVCLSLMMKADETRAMQFCVTQFAQAKTMTDQIVSFALLVNSRSETIREQSIAQFYQQWQKDELVMDKWFAVQASADLPDVLSRVEKLTQHPDFTWKNPNKVRALVGAFSQGNPRHFHDLSGQGYEFLANVIEKLDKINPQIASRLATPFTRWQRYDLPRQGLMMKQLRYLETLSLSPDVSELVSKSLR